MSLGIMRFLCVNDQHKKTLSGDEWSLEQFMTFPYIYSLEIFSFGYKHLLKGV